MLNFVERPCHQQTLNENFSGLSHTAASTKLKCNILNFEIFCDIVVVIYIFVQFFLMDIYIKDSKYSMEYQGEKNK
jgi:hypothetical protein